MAGTTEADEIGFVDDLDLQVARHSARERAEWRAHCMEELGLPAEAVGSGEDWVLVYRAPAGRESDFDEAAEACEAEAVGRFGDPPRPSLGQIYAGFLDAAECLRKVGYDIEPAPSLETFTDDYNVGKSFWNPYSLLPLVDQDEWERLNDECPKPLGAGEIRLFGPP